jgi:molybdopterin-synthase adenylyltransferase
MPPADPDGLTPEQRRRYGRQIRVAGIGEAGQRRLLGARVLIVGMGGLGSPAALYLAAAGVGTLVVSDFDRVEESNLQRQIIHRQADIGEHKARSARRALEALNPACRVIAKDWQLDGEELEEEIHRADLVLDCSDNFATRFALNRACWAARRPLVSGAAIRREGQIVSFVPPQGPCYQCLYPAGLEGEETCAMEGVLAPLVGVVGSLQALEAVNILTAAGPGLRGRLLLLDGATMEWRAVRVPADPACPVCAAVPPRGTTEGV